MPNIFGTNNSRNDSRFLFELSKTVSKELVTVHFETILTLRAIRTAAFLWIADCKAMLVRPASQFFKRIPELDCLIRKNSGVITMADRSKNIL